MSTWIRTWFFDSRLVYIWKVIHSQKTKLPVTITSFWNSIFLSVSELEKSIFLDLVLLCFTPQLLPTLSIDLLDGQPLILCQLHCHLLVSEFSTQWNSIGQKKQRWKAVLEPGLLTFTLLVCRTKQDAWYKQIRLMKGSDFLIIRSSQHFIGNTFTRTALRELH